MVQTSPPGLLLATSFVLSCLLLGCAASTKDTIVITQPVSQIETAIQSVQRDDEAKPVVDPEQLPSRIAIMPLANDTEAQGAAELLRRTLQNHLSTKNFQLVHWREVDLQLVSLPPETLGDNALLARSLGVGGLIRGTVTTYEFYYAGVYAHIRMAVDLSLENASGDRLWADEIEITTRAGGVSTSAWGLLLNAAFAAMHLSEKNLLNTADELGRQVATDFPEPEGFQGSPGPRITSVLHDGANRVMRYGDLITIGLKGEPGQRAIASIDGIGNIELRETEPGVYLVDQPVSASWNASNKEVTGRLIGAGGATSQWISPAGLVSFDNTAPAAIEDLQLAAHTGRSYLSWSPSAASDFAAYRVYSLAQDARHQAYEGTDTEVSLPQETDFVTVRYEVTAVDQAGNESIATGAATRSYPIPGPASARVADSRLGGTVSGALLLSRVHSPFVVTDELILNETAELYVEPGVAIRMAPQGTIKIRGAAYFWGEKAAIRFEPLAGTAVKQYLLLDSDKPVILENVRFSNAGLAIEVRSGEPAFTDTHILDSEYSALSISGSARPLFKGCVIAGSHTSGVVVEQQARPQFSGCSFRDNEPFHIQNTSIYAISAEDNQWLPAASGQTILGEVNY